MKTKVVNGIKFMEAADKTVVGVRASGITGSEDGRGIVFDWKCGHCGYAKNGRINTRSGKPSKQCDWCMATNTFDLSVRAPA